MKSATSRSEVHHRDFDLGFIHFFRGVMVTLALVIFGFAPAPSSILGEREFFLLGFCGTRAARPLLTFALGPRLGMNRVYKHDSTVRDAIGLRNSDFRYKAMQVFLFHADTPTEKD
jgi:hypothetical protein